MPIILLFLMIPKIVFATENIAVSVGEQKLVPIEGQGQPLIANSKSALITKLNGKLKILGKSPGVIYVYHGRDRSKETRITVFTQLMRPAVEQIQALKEMSMGIKFEIKPQKVEILGEIYRLADWRELAQVRRKFPSFVVIKANPSPEVKDRLKEQLESQIQDLSIAGSKVTETSEGLQLSFNSKDTAGRRLLFDLASEWGLPPPKETRALIIQPVIEIDILIAEVKKNSNGELGINWPGQLQGSAQPSGNLGSFSTIFEPLKFGLSAQVVRGGGKVLANPKLICRSGETARFLAGGELPIKMMKWKESEVQWKKYGVILDISPKADLSGVISTRVLTEVSLIDEQIKVDGVPGFLTNRVETYFDLEQSKTIALSGLIKSEMAKTQSGIPGLSSIPIFGELFKSSAFKKSETELVIFVTPRIVDSRKPAATPPPSFWEDEVAL